MKDEQNSELILNQIADEFPDCIDYWREFNRYRFNLKNLLPLLPKNGAVLDLGAGNGVMAVAFQETGAKVTVADNWHPYSSAETNQEKPSMIRMGDRDYILERFRKHRIETIETNLLEGNLPLADNSFDLVPLMAVIEHFPGSPAKFWKKRNEY
jgi:SAM-dependent methyltransferase